MLLVIKVIFIRFRVDIEMYVVTSHYDKKGYSNV